MFVRNVDLALQRAEASYSCEAWEAMTASERSAAIYRELQAMEVQSIDDGSYMPTRLHRRRGRRRGPSA
jgi:acyl-CoA reductase-like NAD-dependent aldehyde dehydrogenase